MEPIGEILKRIRKDTTDKNTGTWSNAEPTADLYEPVCPICKGFKFVYPLLPSGKPDYSQVVPCQCTQQEADKERLARLQRYSNLGSLTSLTFANLNPQGKSKNPADQEQFNFAYQAALAFAEKPDGWLVLTGPSGSGKTHLAAAIANYCILKSHPVFYITVPDLLDHLRASFSPGSEMPYDEFFEQVRNIRLLILDDLGAQSSTGWAKEKLDQLLNHRFNNQLPTVIVSITPLDELEDRLRTRLLNASFCQIYRLSGELPAVASFDWGPGFELEKGMTFENFDWKREELTLEQRQNLEAAFNLARDFARRDFVASPDVWLIFQGDNGCGKTHLAAAIVNYRHQMKQPALFIVVPDLLDRLRSTFHPDSKLSYDQYFEEVKNTSLLILDDLGKQTTTQWAQEKLYQLINFRYNARLPMVVTTNCTIDELDSPISSRFVHPKISTFFHITAPGYWTRQSSQKKISRTSRRER
ncbi:MAG: ATP-binding protein [Chloroflexota bacterium]